jgi:hypothetical protein
MMPVEIAVRHLTAIDPPPGSNIPSIARPGKKSMECGESLALPERIADILQINTQISRFIRASIREIPRRVASSMLFRSGMPSAR